MSPGCLLTLVLFCVFIRTSFAVIGTNVPSQRLDSNGCSCLLDSSSLNCSISREGIPCNASSLLSEATASGRLNGISHVSFHSCELKEVPEDLWRLLLSFKSIDLSKNSLNEFTIESSSQNVRQMNLSSNNLLSFNFENILRNLPFLSLLDLSKNYISNVHPPKTDLRANQTVIIKGNQIVCSRHNLWLIQHLELTAKQEFTESKCGPGSLSGLPFTQVIPVLENPTCSLCHCFLLKQSQLVLSVNCSNLGLMSLPQDLPPQTKEVYLQNNFIQELNFSSSWSSVIYLYLQNNSIESLKGLEGNPFASNLRYLQLERNRLTAGEAHVLKHLNVDRIFLRNNPWKCDCNTIPFQLWIQEHATRVPDIEDINCAGPSTAATEDRNGVRSSSVENKESLSLQTIYKIPKSDLCPQPVAGQFGRYALFDYLNIFLALLIVSVIIKMVYDWRWQRRTGKLPRFFKVNI